MSEAMKPAEKQKRYRERLNEQQMERNRQATAARKLFYALERCQEQGVTLRINTARDIDPFSDVEQRLNALAVLMLREADKKKTKKSGASKAATNGTHLDSPAPPLQETVKRKRRNSATVKQLKAHVSV